MIEGPEVALDARIGRATLRPSRATWLASAIAVALLIAVSFPAAGAARSRPRPVPFPPSAVPWVAQYQLTLDGTQDGSWSAHHQPQPPCDGGYSGSGSQQGQLSGSNLLPIFVDGIGPQLTNILIAGEKDFVDPLVKHPRLAEYLAASVSVTREGSLQSGAAADPTQCPSGDGGGPSAPPQPDCGAREEPLHLWFERVGPLLRFEQPPDFSPQDPYAACPYLGFGVYPNSSPVTVPLRLDGWGPPPPIGTGGGPVRLEGSGGSQQHDADLDASASEKLRLTFAPLFITPTIILGDARSERVAPDGTIGIPVTCPTPERAGCRGRVGLAIVTASTSAVGDPPDALPVASHAFSLRPGTSARVLVRIGRGSRTYARSLAQAPLAIFVSVGGRHPIRYLAGATKLRIR